MIEPVAELKHAPIVGKFYLVPAIHMARYIDYGPLWWPTHGHRHDDAEFFDFPHQHYHVDQRFLTNRHIRQLGNFESINGMGPIERSFAGPITGRYAHVPKMKDSMQMPPDPVLRKMKCIREMPDMPFPFFGTKLHAHYAGTVAKRGRLGLVCPHRQYPLGQCKVDENGIITCPLHGLRIRAVDGVCVDVSGRKVTA